jgi:hypothetical protein
VKLSQPSLTGTQCECKAAANDQTFVASVAGAYEGLVPRPQQSKRTVTTVQIAGSLKHEPYINTHAAHE